MKTASNSLHLTCDRQGILSRTAVWQGTEITDIYLDWMDKPNLVGAKVRGRVARLLPKQKLAFIDCGLEENVTVAGDHNLKEGSFVAIEIIATARQGKAWQGALIQDTEEGPGTGILSPAPFTWQRAIKDLGSRHPTTLTFESREDLLLCHKEFETSNTPLLTILQPLAKTPVHPDLSDMIDLLSKPRVSLSQEAHLIIEQTEALVAIDVNANGGHPMTINMLAVQALARQMRLRNLSGALVMDCLKMEGRTDAFKLTEAAQKAFLGDPAKPQVFGLTKLGFLEITRKRRGPSLDEILNEVKL